jgi:hypothetical protein
MIIEIALGVALGLFIFVNWRGLLSLSTLVLLILVLLVLAGSVLWALYSGLEVVRSLPPVLEPGSIASIIVGGGGGILLNIMFAFAVGTVLEQRLRLVRREALVLGATFYILFLVSAFASEMAISSYLDTKAISAPLLLSVLLAAWVLAIQQCVRRARAARRRVACRTIRST